MKALLNMLFSRRRQAAEEVPAASPARKAFHPATASRVLSPVRQETQPSDCSGLFHETRISLFSENQVFEAEVRFSFAEDFRSWCNKNKYVFETRLVDSGNVICGGNEEVGLDVKKTFLTKNERIPFAEVRSLMPQSIELREAGLATDVQKEFLEFCRLACASSSTHSIFLKEKNCGPYENWFNQLPSSLKAGCSANPVRSA